VITSVSSIPHDFLCRKIRDKFIGIYNGLDDTMWDPALDSTIPETYSLEKMAGKSICKTLLRQELDLPMVDNSVPLVCTLSSHISSMSLNFVYLDDICKHSYR
jgi:starch synthase